MSQGAGRYPRTTSGMVVSMAVLVLLVGGFIALRELNRPDLEVPVKTVDYEKTVEYARQQVDLPIVAPTSLPEGWRATSVRFTPQPPRWHLGVLTAEERYVGLEQSRGSEAKMVERYVDPEARRGEPVQIEGETWRTWTDEGGDTALTRVEDDVTTLVVGTPEREVLVDYAASLR